VLPDSRLMTEYILEDHPNEVDSQRLWNVGLCLTDYTVQHSRRQPFYRYRIHYVSYFYQICLELDKMKQKSAWCRKIVWTNGQHIWLSEAIMVQQGPIVAENLLHSVLNKSDSVSKIIKKEHVDYIALNFTHKKWGLPYFSVALNM
jgi:hypothetical protein